MEQLKNYTPHVAYEKSMPHVNSRSRYPIDLHEAYTEGVISLEAAVFHRTMLSKVENTFQSFF
jgi:hypothetical protein